MSALSRGNVPAYRLPRRTLPGFAWSTLTLRPRSFVDDARAAVAALAQPARLLGAQNVPRHGPCLVACNHFTRPGFAAWWLVLTVTAAVAAQRAPGADPQVHWVIAGAWTYPHDDWRHRVLTPLTYRVFARVAAVYGFVTMPPMPPHPQQVEARAAAVRRTVRLGRQLVQVGGMLGLAPEGGDVPEGLGQPPAGAGEFIALLVKMGFPVLPVGVAEPDGYLCISFGPPFTPELPAARSARDGVVARQVMDAIAAQLPLRP